MNFKKQDNPTNCGIYALLNAATWAGDKHIDLSELKYKENIGVLPKDFERFLKKNKTLPFKLEEIVYIPSIKDLRSNVNDNSCVILGIDDGNWSHVGLLIKMTKDYATLVNWGKKEVIRRVHINTLRKWISKWSIMYVIKRLEK